ncbi:response regulator [Halogranum rubrum]|uniref:Response regulatory domain-containing protein n=1 Tax=Halogranum salarium B-1 TaxID=1210908 RepID=J2ZJF0_9EURY|nr:response regulator [Halogranum salarium]EJN60845.1 hypothetical protein HSB1_14480 [Halogranum salarium B-1]
MTDAPVVLALAAKQRNLELLTDALTGEGYAVERTTSHAEATRLLERPRFDLAVVDVDGFSRAILTVVEALHARQVPVVVLSRRVSSALRKRAMEAGALVILEKPVPRGELSHQLRVLVPKP